MDKLKILIIFCIVISKSQFLLAQTEQEPLVSGLFPGISFEVFAKRIEKDYPYQIYFSPEDVKGISVNLSARNNSLGQVLQSIFEGTDLKYFIDERNRVFISKETPLNMGLAKDFFDYLQKNEEQEKEEIRLSDTERAFSRNKLYIIGERKATQQKAFLRGKITGLETGNPVFGAVLYEKTDYLKAVANIEGEYEIELPVGRHTIFIQNIGGFVEQRQISLQGDGILDIAIEENIISLSEVVIRSEKISNIARPEMGVQKLNMKTMKSIPMVLGEVDVIRSILTLPGVQTVGEASVGFNVRGGAADQNLILYNHATIYNPSHLFGLFSAFNPDGVESVDLYKAGIPVKYGGRLSSVLNVNGSYGNTEKIKVHGGIGLLTGRLSVEGPIGEKTTFMVGGRSTYSDWLLDLLEENTDFKNGRAAFKDFNLNVSHRLNNKNFLKINGYFSDDSFQFDRDTVFGYQNKNFNLIWTHFFNEKLEVDFVAGIDYYNFSIERRNNPNQNFNLGFDLRQNYFKANFRYELHPQHKLDFGLNTINYSLNPGYISPSGEESLILEDRVNSENALETSLFIGDEFEVNDRLSISLGGRYIIYQYLGPNSARYYLPDQSKSPGTLVEERSFGRNEIIHTHHGPEFRISGRWMTGNFSSIKAGYNTGRQFIHQLTNNAAMAPTDIWKLSDNNIAPQWADQVSIGYYQNIKIDKYEISVEFYHRNLKNLLDFRSGGTFLLNPQIEQDVLRTDGRSYGAEFMLRKNVGRLNGWISYFYSRSLLRTSPIETAEQVNGGNWYPNNFDQPHNVVLIGNYSWTKRLSTSLNTTYSTGRPITLPVAKFMYGGSERIYFSDRNAYRIPDYMRVDLSVNIEGNHKIRKLAHSSWSLGVYNLLGRRNPYSVYFTPVNGVLQGYQLSIFARPIPFISYNFRI